MTDEERLLDIGIRRALVAGIYELKPVYDWEIDQDRLLNDDVPWLLSRVHALEAQAAIGRLAQEYVGAVCAEHETETLGLDDEAFGVEWERRWDVADAAYVRLREAVDAALAAREAE
jgi:hypothetical protein